MFNFKIVITIRYFNIINNNEFFLSFAIKNQGSTAIQCPPTPIPGFTPNTNPLVENVYWSVQFNTVPGNNIGTIALYVNGTNVYTAGSGGGTFSWTSAGATQGYTNGSGIIYDVQIN